MSKIGRKPVAVPEGVELKLEGLLVKVKGPKGELKMELCPEVKFEVKDGQVWFKRVDESRTARAMHGTIRSLVKNMIIGVSEGYEKKLELIGVGYKAELKGKSLMLSLGFIKPVEYPLPDGILAGVAILGSDKRFTISLKGINKQVVGEVAAEIRSLRPPEPYQGKGIRYQGEYVRHKAGKAAVAGGTPGATAGK